MNKKFSGTLILFYISGFLVSYFYQKNIIKNINAKETEDPIIQKSMDSTKIWIQQDETGINNSLKSPIADIQNSKFTITEIEHITADKYSAETGDTVNLKAAIKNTGTKKKFLTHICINDDQGNNYGCILNKNLESGETFSFNSSVQLKNPGNYWIHLTWSQDKTNFYQPNNTSSVHIEIY
jgi:hypothetical protein